MIQAREGKPSCAFSVFTGSANRGRNMEKQKMTVCLAGKNYTLVSSDPPEYVRRVAALVNRRLNEMEMAGGMPSPQAAVLACMNLADELLKAKDENTELKKRMQKMLADQTEKTESGMEQEARNSEPKRMPEPEDTGERKGSRPLRKRRI